MDYPLPIQSTDFHDTNVAAASRDEFELQLSRRYYGSKIGNTANLPECGILDLWVVCPNTHKKSKKSFHAAHSPISSNSGDRFHFAPGAESLNIFWKFKNPQYITAAKIELFRKSTLVEAAIWSKEIKWDDKPCAEEGETYFDGNVDINYYLHATRASTVTVANPLGLAFPGDYITVEHSPYKLKMTITGHLQGANVTKAVRWLYLDVLLKELALSFGSHQELDPARADITHTFQWTPAGAVLPQTVTLRTEVLQLEQQIIQNLGEPTDDNQIILDSSDHAFNTDSKTMYGNDEMYRRHKQLWGNGPRISIYAEVMLRSSNDRSVSSPIALGDLRFLWDWEDGNESKLKRWATRGFQTETKKFLENALDYLVDIETAQGHQPHGSTNCHKDRGGKRGEGAEPIFPVQTAAGYLPATAALIPGVFPIQVGPCNQRNWAVESHVRCTGFKAGFTGVLFQPSRIAGDTYKITVYFIPPDGRAAFPFNANAKDIKKDVKAPHTSTGLFEMWRRFNVFYFKKGNTETGDVNALQTIYSEGGILLNINGPTPFPGGPYQTAMTAGIQAFLQDQGAGMTRAQQAYLIPAAQTPGDYALELLDLNNYLTALQGIDAQTLVELDLANAGVYAKDNIGLGPALGPTNPAQVLCNELGNPARITVATNTVPAVGDHVHPQGGGGTIAINAVRVLNPVEKATFMSNIYRFTTGMNANQLQMRFTQIKEGLTNQILKRFAIAYIDTNHPNDKGIFFFHFKTRVIGEVLAQPVTGWAPADAGEPHRSIFFATTDYQGWQGDATAVSDFPGKPTRADLKHWKPRDPVIAHEIGHNLCLAHAEGGAADSTAKDYLHVALPNSMTRIPIDKRTHCLMNYHPKAKRFCGYCILRLRGWSALGATDDANSDEIILLHNTADGNQPSGIPEILPKQKIIFLDQRQRVCFRVSKPFNGNALLTRDSAGVRVFDAPVVGTEITFNGADNLFTAASVRTGKWLYLEGAAPDKVKFTLDPQDGQTPAEYEFDIVCSWGVQLGNRIQVTFRYGRNFVGNALLTRNSAGVRVFDSPAGGTETLFDGNDNLFPAATVLAGKTLYLEGAVVGQVIFTLDPQNGTTPALFTVNVMP